MVILAVEDRVRSAAFGAQEDWGAVLYEATSENGEKRT